MNKFFPRKECVAWNGCKSFVCHLHFQSIAEKDKTAGRNLEFWHKVQTLPAISLTKKLLDLNKINYIIGNGMG
jgi:hypothetical protein